MRVHPEILERQKLPPRLLGKRHLGRAAARTSPPSSATSAAQGVVILKFFLNVSKDEQKRAS